MSEPADWPVASRGRTVLISSVASDSHTWNLVFLQLLVEELGCEVVNLGPCVPDELLVSECLDRRPHMLVISSVNGHGYQDGARVVRKLRERPELATTPMVIGGKLGIAGPGNTAHVDALIQAGFDAVFEDGAEGLALFRSFVGSLPARVSS
ncbi:methylaspartate mutase sigma subunit [Kutzneria viridogrisea]|nr:cobalamin-dependent protein [Kutzneria albida]MBA8927801.1 methylaspartate mutase sigma subunit [Kutzneria viridogrisea]